MLPSARVSGVLIFSGKGQIWVKVTKSQIPPKASVMFTHGRRHRHSRRGRRLQTRPTPLLGLVHCQRLSMRRSATARTAACYVGSRRRHAFLLIQLDVMALVS